MGTLYNILIYLAAVFIETGTLFSKKLRLFTRGRRGVFDVLSKSMGTTVKTIWMHCASLGEYEQGLPVLEKLRASYPGHKILLTFFSPSGYEVKKDSTLADVVAYLPLDTRRNARRFVQMVQPRLALFVKYEFWPNYLSQLRKNNVPTLLISGLFRKGQPFFKPVISRWMRKGLGAFEHFFVQDKNSEELLWGIGLENVTVSGDTRFDRVMARAGQDNSLDFVARFKGEALCVVAGSTWPEDEAVLVPYFNNTSDEVKCIIAPHRIEASQIQRLRASLDKKCLLYSEMEGQNPAEYDVLVIDTIGLLGKIYHYADIAYVGGAMGKTGLHNILEPAAFGVPVVIGKNFKKFPEAAALQEKGGLFSVSGIKQFEEVINELYNNEFRERSGAASGHFVAVHAGATERIMEGVDKIYDNF